MSSVHSQFPLAAISKNPLRNPTTPDLILYSIPHLQIVEDISTIITIVALHLPMKAYFSEKFRAFAFIYTCRIVENNNFHFSSCIRLISKLAFIANKTLCAVRFACNRTSIQSSCIVFVGATTIHTRTFSCRCRIISDNKDEHFRMIHSIAQTVFNSARH